MRQELGWWIVSKIISALKKIRYLKKFLLLLPPLPSLTPPTILPSLSFPPLPVTTKIKISQSILTVATVQDVAGFDTKLFVAPTPSPSSNKQTERQRQRTVISSARG